MLFVFNLNPQLVGKHQSYHFKKIETETAGQDQWFLVLPALQLMLRYSLDALWE